MKNSINIGILNIQGDIEENTLSCEQVFKKEGIPGKTILVKSLKDIQSIDGLIIPGGESTVISTLLFVQNLQLQAIKDRISNGMPTLGTCAGLILLANKVYDRILGETKQQTIGGLNVTVERNSFGRQKDSFEIDLNISILDKKPFRAVFIRGPVIKGKGEDVEVISKIGDKVVAVREENIIGTSFHPELSDDKRLHKYFIKMVSQYKNNVLNQK